jgi:hypothetical protein
VFLFTWLPAKWAIEDAALLQRLRVLLEPYTNTVWQPTCWARETNALSVCLSLCRSTYHLACLHQLMSPSVDQPAYPPTCSICNTGDTHLANTTMPTRHEGMICRLLHTHHTQALVLILPALPRHRLGLLARFLGLVRHLRQRRTSLLCLLGAGSQLSVSRLCAGCACACTCVYVPSTEL